MPKKIHKLKHEQKKNISTNLILNNGHKPTKDLKSLYQL